MKRANKQQLIDRLAEAITEYREHPPQPAAQMKTIRDLAIKYGFSRKTMETAIAMLAGGINGGEEI